MTEMIYFFQRGCIKGWRCSIVMAMMGVQSILVVLVLNTATTCFAQGLTCISAPLPASLGIAHSATLQGLPPTAALPRDAHHYPKEIPPVFQQQPNVAHVENIPCLSSNQGGINQKNFVDINSKLMTIPSCSCSSNIDFKPNQISSSSLSFPQQVPGTYPSQCPSTNSNPYLNYPQQHVPSVSWPSNTNKPEPIPCPSSLPPEILNFISNNFAQVSPNHVAPPLQPQSCPQIATYPPFSTLQPNDEDLLKVLPAHIAALYKASPKIDVSLLTPPQIPSISLLPCPIASNKQLNLPIPQKCLPCEQSPTISVNNRQPNSALESLFYFPQQASPSVTCHQCAAPLPQELPPKEFASPSAQIPSMSCPSNFQLAPYSDGTPCFHKIKQTEVYAHPQPQFQIPSGAYPPIPPTLPDEYPKELISFLKSYLPPVNSCPSPKEILKPCFETQKNCVSCNEISTLPYPDNHQTQHIYPHNAIYTPQGSEINKLKSISSIPNCLFKELSTCKNAQFLKELN